MQSRRFSGAIIGSLAMIALASCGGEKEPEIKFEHPTIYNASEVRTAIGEAKASLPLFWAELDDPAPDAKEFRVMVRQPAKQHDFDYIWVENIERSDEALSGEIVDNAKLLQGKRKDGDRITFAEADIYDWTYYANEGFYGQFTLRAKTKTLVSPGTDISALERVFHPDPLPPPRE